MGECRMVSLEMTQEFCDVVPIIMFDCAEGGDLIFSFTSGPFDIPEDFLEGFDSLYQMFPGTSHPGGYSSQIRVLGREGVF